MLLQIALPLLLSAVVLAKDRKTLKGLLDTCMDSTQHKTLPRPDTDLTGECAPWKERACCYGAVQPSWMDLSWDHCPQADMSAACKRWFRKDNCLFFCSANLGPWITPFGRKHETYQERVKKVPMCESQCATWWDACKNDYSCTDNWRTGFNWINGTNHCKTPGCKQFKEYFSDARSFCEGVWVDSYTVVPDTSPCMVLDFTGSNPNEAVAKCHAQTIVNNSAFHYISAVLLIFAVVISSRLCN